MSLRIPGEVARLAIKDMESLERKLLRRSSEERIGLAEGGSLSVNAGRSLSMGESLSAGSWAKAERSVGLKDNRLSRLSSLRRGSRSSLSLTSSSRAASGTKEISQGLVEARVAKVWAGMATITFTSFVSKRFSSSKFKMMGSMDIGREGNRRGLEERNEINCEVGRCSTIKVRMEGF